MINSVTKTRRSVLTAIALMFLASFVVTGCRDPGPAEEAGREVDDAVEEARDAMEEFGDEAEEALEEIENNDD